MKIQLSGRSGTRTQPRVLMQNRPNALTHRGGDTVVMERLRDGLEARGVSVTVDLTGQADPAQFDLVHLFNFALPDVTKYFAERAFQARVPFVVTTLCEDISRFHNQSLLVSHRLLEYVQRGQDRAWYEDALNSGVAVGSCAPFDNSWVAQHAGALFTNGETESRLVKRLYPGASKVVEIKLGHQMPAHVDKSLFEKEFGVSDFILCVGRLETRKNQLMLLKALENSAHPVVLAAGGFSYQPDYERSVRAFRRRGRTIVVGRLSPELLSSAYAAARVHILPSWYELPGLVSLEAAFHGCQIVVTDRGTSRDYFGDHAYYCDPDNELSILNGVLAAYSSPVRPELKELVMKYSWEETVNRTLDQYQELAGIQPSVETPSKMKTIEVGLFDMSAGATDFQETLERGELAARNREYNLAHELLEQAERLNPRSVRMLRARGAVHLAEGNVTKARMFFERAIQNDSTDARSLSGLGMCELNEQHYEAAYTLTLKALGRDSCHLVGILQLVQCAYAIGKFDDLERVLRNYLTEHPNDLEMRYCLGGCLFKQNQFDEARRISNEVLQRNAQHVGAKQLLEMIDSVEAEAKAKAAEAAAIAPPQPIALGLVDEIENLKRDKKYSDALARLEESEARGEDFSRDERAAALKAELLVLHGRLDEGGALFKKILQSNGRSARALAGLGVIAAASGDRETARSMFEQSLLIDNRGDVALAGMGLVEQWSDNIERAWDFFQSAFQSNPENARALLGLIDLAYRMRRLPELEEALRTYLDYHPADIDFLYALSGCLYAQNRLNEASQELHRILALQSMHPLALELMEAIASRQNISAAVAQGAA